MRLLALAAFLAALTPLFGQQPKPQDTELWEPVPKVVTPGAGNAAPPSDAIMLFDGRNIEEWVTAQDKLPAGRIVAGGALTVNRAPGVGNIETRRTFRNYQLHLEWKIPEGIAGDEQARGNSGVFLASTGTGDAGYELQIPPVNPNRKTGEWQTCDVAWSTPAFNPDGSLKGETLNIGQPFYREYYSAPIKLHAHGDRGEPIGFRNMWVGELN